MVHFLSLFLLFIILSAGGDSMIDTIASVDEYMDLDLFLVTVMICDGVDQVDLLHRPSKTSLVDIKKRTNELLAQLGVKRYDVSKHQSSTQYFLDHMVSLQKKKNQENKNVIISFLDKYFSEPASDIKAYNSLELAKPPKFSICINNSRLRNLLQSLHERWNMLYKETILNANDRMSTLIVLPHPFIVPGGRFRELYYWDTWFVLEGLIASGLKEASVNMLKNFIYLIDQYRFIPNGTRKYYLNRSQPPFFCLMLESMLKFEDQAITDLVLGKGLDMAIRELNWFEERKHKTFLFEEEKKEMFFYFVESDYPRVESFREDLRTFNEALDLNQSKLKEEALQIKIFSSLKSGAESGIDFSSRWFGDGKNMSSINAINQVPVDLNALIYKNKRVIAMLLRKRGNLSEARKYEDEADDLARLINTVLWNKAINCWNDFNTSTRKHVSKRFYPSNFFPLFFGIKPPNGTAYDVIAQNKCEIFGYVGGIPASGNLKDKNTGQQWDFNNVWAPHSYLFHLYFKNVLNEPEMAFHVAKGFFESVIVNFEEKKLFYEKYTALDHGSHGGGGEYETQDGFGWTNGTTICYIREYGDDLMKPFEHEVSCKFIEKKLEEMIEQGIKATNIAEGAKLPVVVGQNDEKLVEAAAA